MVPLAPPFKWPGGKRRQVEAIASRFPTPRPDLYVEPFLGAGAVFYGYGCNSERAWLSDCNWRVVAMHEVIRDCTDDLLGELDRLPWGEEGSRAQYYALRERFNSLPTSASPLMGALFLWLNRRCYNGLYRENRKGEFNVPVGSNRMLRPAEEHLRACAGALASAHLATCAFENSLQRAIEAARKGRAVQIYADPPYMPLSKTAAFVGYSSGGFTLEDQLDLRDMLNTAADAGAKVVASNSSPARDLYAGWEIEEIKAPRTIGCKSRASVRELLMTRGGRDV